MTIRLKTNYNNKLGSQAFVHVAPIRAASIPESKMNQVYTIETEDGSHPPVDYRLFDLLRVELGKLCSLHTLPSHGVECFDFIDNFLKEQPETKLDLPMAVYYYIRPEVELRNL